MKPYQLAFICCVCAPAAVAQSTNVFPSTGSMGLGTTTPSPSFKADVVGSIRLQSPAGSHNNSFLDSADTSREVGFVFRSAGANKWQLFKTTVDDFSFYNYGANQHQLYLSSSGNVGIGTPSASQKLDVNGTIAVSGQAALSSDAASIYVGDLRAGDGVRSLVFRTNDSSQAIIDGYGQLGLGTLNPQTKLDVIGPVGIAGGVKQSWGDHNNYVQYPSQYVANPTFFMGWSTHANTRRLFIDNKHSDAGLNDPQGGITFRTGTGLAERVHISQSGNFGIGTNLPQAMLDVMGPVQFAGNISQQWGDYENYVKYPSAYAANPSYMMGWKTLSSTRRLFIDNQNQDASASGVSGGITLRTGQTLTERLHVTRDGLVGINTVNPTHQLTVNGAIRAREVVVETNIAASDLKIKPGSWSDYVFDPEYKLPSLREVEKHITEKRHLPGIPSASEVAEQGVSVGEMQAKLLAKVEELTLHVIRLEKEMRELRAQNQELQTAR